ncbi:MAG: hypothetical protein ACI97B_003569, partial [Verrucomicrobiales bacterium]
MFNLIILIASIYLALRLTRPTHILLAALFACASMTLLTSLSGGASWWLVLPSLLLSVSPMLLGLYWFDGLASRMCIGIVGLLISFAGGPILLAMGMLA